MPAWVERPTLPDHLERKTVTEDNGGKGARVMERVSDRRRLHQAWHTVRSHAGAAGIDRMTVEAFAERAEELLNLICDKLQTGTYRFTPARRVSIPKPGSTKKRNRGMPVVMDRIVSHSVPSVLEELCEPDFTTSNFGFRRGKSQHQAIGHVRQAVVEGYEWCAAMDLQGFFDEIPHDLILKLIRRKRRDERVVTLSPGAEGRGERRRGPGEDREGMPAELHPYRPCSRTSCAMNWTMSWKAVDTGIVAGPTIVSSC